MSACVRCGTQDVKVEGAASYGNSKWLYRPISLSSKDWPFLQEKTITNHLTPPMAYKVIKHILLINAISRDKIRIQEIT